MDHINQLVRLHEQQMRATAAHFELWTGDGRKRSAQALVDLFFGVTHALQPNLFVEAGAKTGETSLRVRGICPHARIVAFEANPYNHRLYSAQFRHGERSVEYLHSALADQPGKITFNIIASKDGEAVSRNTGMNSILERRRDGIDYERVTVPATTLDHHFASPGRTVLWVDVEGASRQVLAGGDRVLASTDAMLIELEDKPSWKDQWNSTDALIHLYERGLTPVARDFEYRTQHNALLLSEKALNDPEVRVNLEYYFSALVRQRGA